MSVRVRPLKNTFISVTKISDHIYDTIGQFKVPIFVHVFTLMTSNVCHCKCFISVINVQIMNGKQIHCSCPYCPQFVIQIGRQIYRQIIQIERKMDSSIIKIFFFFLSHKKQYIFSNVFFTFKIIFIFFIKCKCIYFYLIHAINVIFKNPSILPKKKID